MKTDGQKLSMLIDYLALNKEMAYHRLWAQMWHEVGDEVTSWRMLFTWAELREERSEMWQKFQKHYPDAIFLREGVA